MDKEGPSEQRIAVWMSMADHFLDTDTTDEVPATARLCVEAGLSIDEARAIWRYEVTPALYLNIWSVAGEWACWDRGALVQRIFHTRARLRGPLGYLLYRIRVHFNHSVWLEIESCMRSQLEQRS